MLIACSSCGALVTLREAQRAARTNNMPAISGGDGCICVSKTQVQRFLSRHEKRLYGIRDESYVLIDTPESLSDTTRARMSSSRMCQHAERALVNLHT